MDMDQHWTVLSPRVSRFTPPPSTSSASPDDPALCLLFGWMDARVVHLRKYADTLHEIYPAATILIVRSGVDSFYASQSASDGALKPAVETLLQLADEGRLSSGVLIHSFSNGGALQLTTLSALLARLAPRPAPIHAPTALVLDSAPGAHGLASMLAAMAPANPLLYLFVAPVLSALYGLLALSRLVSGKGPILHDLRRALLVPHPLAPLLSPSAASNGTPRVYVYGAKDKMVPASAIEAHIASAKQAGLDVEPERFEASPHVAHARAEPERYWDAVKRVWTRACEQFASSQRQ